MPNNRFSHSPNVSSKILHLAVGIRDQGPPGLWHILTIFIWLWRTSTCNDMDLDDLRASRNQRGGKLE